eukprot:scaffold316842_cov30-Tisochrysis_lutea.AAC.1
MMVLWIRLKRAGERASRSASATERIVARSLWCARCWPVSSPDAISASTRRRTSSPEECPTTYISHTTLDCYLGLIMPAVSVLQNEAVALGRKLVVRYGKIENLARGHTSANGSGTICDLDSGSILAQALLSAITVSARTHSARLAALSTRRKPCMDAIDCGEMIDDVVHWHWLDSE